ncbi:uncharacterized protein PODANS_6_2250 [Podospora anserina S mat+]|uniref:Podospora anserina S mat+ genomic DNA chromosome 6, supercontig 2 n=1 Tax=Podospora anserina (strain S / ATCC MYA-4624 / DSM 980 / FGSC 10383) TaxID=515849 RepID=B2B2S3_PODAN|nr:uncharacterized protein PODANS_6_2250 [Podospora anserina S mat+]CAP71409.1 unnamed protein product [Podospora anserina S mat+]CDP30807.1 Putative protein of unknown function [Podospora anserina S mat+]
MLSPKLLVLAALSSASVAFDPATDTTCNDQGICLSSFIWCDKNGQSCSYPEGADALIPSSTAASYAVLYHHVEYEIRWRQAKRDTDVLIEWLFDGSPFQSEEEKSARELPVMWSTNVTTSSTEGSFTFDPFTILKDFPTQHAPNMSAGEAASSASGMANTIRLSQPGSGFPEVYTNQFSVQSGWAHQLVRNIREEEADVRADEKRKMRLGVGIGVGLGVPLLSAVMWWAGSRHGASRATRSVEGK